MTYISRYDVEKMIRENSPSKIMIDEDATRYLVNVMENQMEEIIQKAIQIAITNKIKKNNNIRKKVKLTKLDIEIAASYSS